MQKAADFLKIIARCISIAPLWLCFTFPSLFVVEYLEFILSSKIIYLVVSGCALWRKTMFWGCCWYIIYIFVEYLILQFKLLGSFSNIYSFFMASGQTNSCIFYFTFRKMARFSRYWLLKFFLYYGNCDFKLFRFKIL